MHFTGEQLSPLVASGFLLVFSIYLYLRGRHKTSLYFLAGGAFLAGCFTALLDPYLILWDEQYHALVARNMIKHPFKPMLIADPALPADYRDWTGNQVWLHKQPFFLWQMALSMKLFGISEFTLRLPSVIMHALLTVVIYRTGRIIADSRTGFIAGLFYAVLYFPLELLAGRYPTDHNDAAFTFYLSCSFWAWFEFRHGGRRYWIPLTGLFAGIAFLVKWIPGLMVFGIWVLVIVSDRNLRKQRQRYAELAAGLAAALPVILPWTLYTLFRFPTESRHEYLLHTRHLTEVIEGHGGPWWYHFKALYLLYGEGQAVPFLLLAGLVFLFLRIRQAGTRVAVFSSLFLVYLVYSLAATKMPAFGFAVAPFVLLGLASLVVFLLDQSFRLIRSESWQQAFTFLVLAGVGWLLFNFPRHEGYHTMKKPNDNFNRQGELAEKEAIMKVLPQVAGGRWVIFNAGLTVNGHIPFMFYTGQTAYDFLPTREQLESVLRAGYRVAVLDPGGLPEFLGKDQRVTRIPIP